MRAWGQCKSKHTIIGFSRSASNLIQELLMSAWEADEADEDDPEKREKTDAEHSGEEAEEKRDRVYVWYDSLSPKSCLTNIPCQNRLLNCKWPYHAALLSICSMISSLPRLPSLQPLSADFWSLWTFRVKIQELIKTGHLSVIDHEKILGESIWKQIPTTSKRTKQ